MSSIFPPYTNSGTPLPLECSPRDDLESLSYMLIYFLRGTLPWRRLKATTISGTWDIIRDAKVAAQSTITHGLPREFSVLHDYARSLNFGDIPDYDGLRSLLRELGERVGARYPDMEDTVSTSGSSSSSSSVPDDWCGFDWMVSRNTERRGRVCEACKRRTEAAWAGTA